ncbi:hypothetical protein [Arthrobacter sp. H20]|uniref:hypothetical protein n=1 Tax=Arthrobacter sp. H20 TaxID=1267981 RepID=UPI00047EE6BB|nr:hypothetical protein [Arthrobacter sp. H20]
MSTPPSDPDQREVPDRAPDSDQLKDDLRKIFDSQIPNYGDYNLVLAANERYQHREPHGARVITPKYYVVGYRWKPTEIMIAPVDSHTLAASGIPVEINMTNLSHVLRLNDGHFEVGTSTGRTFRFGVQPEARFSSGPHSQLTIDQLDDQTDFDAFMTAFIAMV